MEDTHRKVLQKLRLHISRNINARRITETLFSRGVLDENDKESIIAETTTEYKALYLLDLLPRKGPTAFDDFVQALYACNNAFLANSIQSELSGMENVLILYYKPKMNGQPRVHKLKIHDRLLIKGEKDAYVNCNS